MEFSIKKQCNTCDKYKLIELPSGTPTYTFFGRSKTSKDGHVGRCKRCTRSKSLQKTYGITIEDWEAILLSQGGKCAVCGKLQSGSTATFHTDHNHKTGEIRGILCGYCNRRLMTYLHDNPIRAIGLGKYLLKWFGEDDERM